MKWFYAVQDQQLGPVEHDKFLRLIRNGTIMPDTLVWREGMGDWELCAMAWPDGFRPPPQGEMADPETVAPSEPAATAPSALIPDPPTDPHTASFRRLKEKSHYDAIYQGTAGELFPIYLKNILFTVLTLGIYKFWALVHVRKYHYQNTVFAEGRFDYHATGEEKFKGFLKGMAVLIPLGLFLFLFLCFLMGLDPASSGAVSFNLVILITFILTPVVICGARAFNLARTSWNNLRFRFDGSIRKLYGIYIPDILLIMVTFGIYYFWHQVRVKTFLYAHTIFGGERFQYDGEGGEVFGITIANLVLTTITCGIYFPWGFARLHRYHINHTTYQGARFRSTLSGGDVLGTGLACIILVMLTFGLAFPWAIAKWKQVLTDSVYAEGVINLDHLSGETDPNANAFTEGIGEAAETLEAIGDLFGG